MGIPWICDIISAWLFFESGAQHTFAIRLCLDIINLLTVLRTIEANNVIFMTNTFFAGYFDFHCFGWFQPILHQDQGENQIELHQEHIIKYKEIQWYLKESP